MHKDLNLKLTTIQREILVGVLLGDGNLQTFTKGRSYRLRILHSIDQEFYVKHLHESFSNITTMQIKRQTVKNASDLVYFNTNVNGSLRYYAHLFYKQNVRVVPKHIRKLLTPRSLAYWFMDDGSRKGLNYKGYRLCTDCYLKKEVKLLCDTLFVKFGIQCTMFKQRTKWRIYIKSESSDLFETIIYPYILKDFIKFKFHMHSQYY